MRARLNISWLRWPELGVAWFGFGLLALCAVLSGCGGAVQPAGATSIEVAPSRCEAVVEMADFEDLLADLARVGQAELWPGYSLEGHDIVFEWVGGGAPCVAHWSRGRVVAVAEGATRMDLMLGLFGFLITDFADKSAEQRMGGFLVGDLPPSILSSLRERDASAALAWVVDGENLDEPSPFAGALADDPRLWKTFLILHESVHVHLQFARIFAGNQRYRYPSWSQQPERADLIASCFESDAARPLHQRELELNALAVAAAFAGRNDEAIEHALRYVELRRERYLRLADVRIEGQNGAQHTCEQAEAIWELDEGLADYVAARALIEAELADAAWFVERIEARRSSDASFYYTGSGQLMLLWQVAPESLAGALVEVAESGRPEDGIFGQFSRWVESSADSAPQPEPSR